MTEKDNEILAAMAQSLASIDETMSGLLQLLTAREAAFKERKSSFGGDRKPPFRKSFDRDDRGGDRGDRPFRKPYTPRDDRGGDDRGGERGSFRPGPKKSFGPKKTYTPRDDAGAGGGEDRPRKKYKSGY